MELEDVEQEELLSEYLMNVPDAIIKSLNFSCPTCSHKPGAIWPPVLIQHKAEPIMNGDEEDYDQGDDEDYNYFNNEENEYFSDGEEDAEENENEGPDSENESRNLTNRKQSNPSIRVSSRNILSTSPSENEVNENLEEGEGEEGEPMPSSQNEDELNYKNQFSEINDVNPDELVCFHTRKNFKEEILGVGIILEKTSTNFVQSLTTHLDLLSFSAFQEGVRHDVLNRAFTHWIPLFINEEHGRRAYPIIEKAISHIRTNSPNNFKPQFVIQVLPKLMCGMIVNMMSDQIHTSVRALSGYCAFHRLLILFAEKYPKIREYANNTIKNFISDENCRTKKVVPSLGEFLPLLTISSFTWNQVAKGYLDENLDRNVRWIIQKHYKLARCTPDPSIDAHRNDWTFTDSIVSCMLSLPSFFYSPFPFCLFYFVVRLMLFNVQFLELIGKPTGVSESEIVKIYDSNYGMPSREQKARLQQICTNIKSVNSWKFVSFFHFLFLFKLINILFYFIVKCSR